MTRQILMEMGMENVSKIKGEAIKINGALLRVRRSFDYKAFAANNETQRSLQAQREALSQAQDGVETMQDLLDDLENILQKLRGTLG